MNGKALIKNALTESSCNQNKIDSVIAIDYFNTIGRLHARDQTSSKCTFEKSG